jgi:creatinine amidohydrolase/Fe(II)-dependent formamide hydrolase-like protein
MNLAMQMAKQHLNVMTFYPRGPSGTETQRKSLDQMRRFNDMHSGVAETNAALYLFPELVEMWRLDDWEPTLKMNQRLREYMNPDREDYPLVSQVINACREPRTDDFSSDGIYGINDPRSSDPEEYRRHFEERSQFYVDFINLWKTIPLPPAFRD